MWTRLLAPLAVILVLVPWGEVCLAQTPAATKPSGTVTWNRNFIDVVTGAQIRAREAEARGERPVQQTPNAEP
jgi:hypothetical protein